MRKAVINRSTVENIILADDDFELPDRAIVSLNDNSPVAIGWTYDGEDFSAPHEPAPSTDPADFPLLPWQFKALVIYLGVDAQIRTAISKVPDAMQRAATLSRYENSGIYRFDDPLVNSLRVAIGMPVEQLEAAWLQAKDLRSSN